MLNASNEFRGLLKKFDFLLMSLTIITAVFGIIIISSAGGENATRYVTVQTVALLIGVVAIVVLMILDYEYLANLSMYIFIACVGLLVLVAIPGIGRVENGARSWFSLGPISFQPAEIAKIGFIITFSKQLSELDGDINSPKNILKLLAHIAIFCGLILLQPDFGTAVVFAVMAFGMLFVAKISWKYIVGGFSALAAAVPIAWFFFLKEYQKNRIINVFNPENDPSGSGYHVIQSKIAVGSGKVFGTGLYKGSSQFNNLLPERHTDFIYSVVCEELGMLGGILVILLLVSIIARCLYVGMNSRNKLGMYICTGVAAMFIFQSFENIGMCIGIFPVTGITLPFFSYGGSSLLTNMIAIGLVINVHYRCKYINF
ncbi:MAG: rod shape-determining protein RodA [Oscillospiraceae bacterium]